MIRNALVVPLLLYCASLNCWGQSALEPVSLALLDCRPITTVPCFRLQFRISRTLGGLADIRDDQLVRSVTITAGGVSVHVFNARVVARSEVSAAIMRVTVASPYADLASLGGRTLDFDLALQLPDGEIMRPERLVRWRSGDMSPTFEESCDRDERANSPAGVALVTIWRPILVFLAFSCVLLVLALWMPRIFWPPAPPDDLRPVRRSGGNAG
jgi:hypothetical protein